MQQARFVAGHPPACPECETELDGATGTCPACLWDGLRVAAAPQRIETEAPSYIERYGGPSPSQQMPTATRMDSGVARGRLFVIVSMVAVVLLVALVWQTVTLL